LKKALNLSQKCDKNGKTPLFWAAYEGHVEAMKLLLDKDSQLISKCGNDGETPLHLTAHGGHVQAMKFLLEKKLDLSQNVIKMTELLFFGQLMKGMWKLESIFSNSSLRYLILLTL